MTYVCNQCHNIFEEYEIVVETWRESRGECFGFPSMETMSEDHCPCCNSTNIEEYYEESEE